LAEHFRLQESKKAIKIAQQISKKYDELTAIGHFGSIRLHEASLLYLSILTRTVVIENECIDVIKAKVVDKDQYLDRLVAANKARIEVLVKRIKKQKDTLKKFKEELFGAPWKEQAVHASSFVPAPDAGELSQRKQHAIASGSIVSSSTGEGSPDKRRASKASPGGLVRVDSATKVKVYDIEAWMAIEDTHTTRRQQLLADANVVEGLAFEE